MCGIIAHVGRDDSLNSLLTGLQNLEYRGYDSAGVAVQNGNGIHVCKRSGEVSELQTDVLEGMLKGNVGIGHTRWSTHGAPTDENAHPHTDTAGDVAVVHNGIIENYSELRTWLSERGYTFTSETDTEVVPHLISYFRSQGADTETAFKQAIAELEGSYALAVLVDGEEAVYATRRGSPLVLGVDSNEFYLASDVPAFLEYTDEVVYLEDDDVVLIRPDEVEITDLDGNPVSREVKHVDWDPEEAGKGEYDHYMLKEIHTQPTSLSNTIEGRIDEGTGEVTLENFSAGAFADVERVQFVACGTSYHAALYGEQLLGAAGVDARTCRASEYEAASIPVLENTLTIAVTQSGETADTLRALRRAKKLGAKTVAVTNVVGSSAAREADDAIFIRAGPEIGVAATKTFSSQAVTLGLFAEKLADDITMGTVRDDRVDVLSQLQRLPEGIETILRTDQAAEIAEMYLDKDAYFFIGRGLGYPVALEGALKFKEITYEHAEGFAAGELKHGPLALVTSETPVFAVFTGKHDGKTLQNAKEAQTRGADIIAVAPDGHPAINDADARLSIPETHPAWAGLLANVQLQLVSYHTADRLGRSIDKPRNLAKSVTVE
ncbi:glutamine--fructose-6-phosphate transaminase (isomerizing) (plasmid) [Haloferacaceae archaeon DSL9]